MHENPHEHKFIEIAFGWGPGHIWLHTTLEGPWPHNMILEVHVLGRPLDTFFWALTNSWSRFLPQVGDLHRPSFLYEGLRLPKKLDLQRSPLARSVAMLIIISSVIMLELLHHTGLGHSINLGRWRTHFVAIITLLHSPQILDRALRHRSLNRLLIKPPSHLTLPNNQSLS